MNQKNEKELGVMVPEIIAIVGGMISMIIFIIPLEAMLEALGPVVAPLVEEPFKVTGLILLALYYPYTLVTKKNGLILGGLAGLGYAFLENFLYLMRAEMGKFIVGPGYVVTMRAIFPLSMHVLNSALVGYALLFLAKKKIDTNSSNASTNIRQIVSERNMWSIIIVAMALHLQYNLFAGAGDVGLIIGTAIVFFTFYKLYNYFPEKLDDLAIKDPVQLLSNAMKYSEKSFNKNKSDFDGYSERPSSFCAKCGEKLSSEDSFCPGCGNRIKRKSD